MGNIIKDGVFKDGAMKVRKGLLLRSALVLFVVGVFPVLFSGCSNRSGRLEAVLKYSGDNRAELEKVLEHYSHDPGDSLKLQSAQFLIENMPGHYTFAGPFLDEYYARLDTVKDSPYYEKKLFQMIPFDRYEYRSGLEIREDVKEVKADFLIHQIELAFRQWETLPWLEGVDFETFKEYLLPYRVENEPLDYWRDSIAPFQTRLQDYMEYFEDCRYSISHMKNKFYTFINNPRKRIPDANLKDFDMECIPMSKLNLFSNRIIGIPSAIDFIPHFANRNGRHYWAMGIDSKINPFQVFQADIYRAPKIYRRTYSHNPAITPRGKEHVPPFFRDPFNKDVTRLYIPTVDITIDVPRSIDARHVYLAIFNDLTWKPIAASEVSGRKALFPDMGKDIAYLPVYYDEEEEMHPIGSPFTVMNSGEIRHLTPSADSMQSLTLVRKYPNTSEHEFWYRVLLDTRFEASDDEDFKRADTIFTITKTPDYRYQFITPDTTIRKRYWRFIGNKRYRCYLGDLRFYDMQQKEIRGRVMQVDSVQAQAIFDDSPETYGSVKDWLGMDFGKPVSISKIRYLTRNDANGIYPDNDYELFYYRYPEGWHSLGIKTATGYELNYDRVPAGALYWLRNLTAGQEERIFTWENGRARFW